MIYFDFSLVKISWFRATAHLICHRCLYDIFPEIASSAENVVFKMTIIIIAIKNVLMFSADYFSDDSESEIIELSLADDKWAPKLRYYWRFMFMTSILRIDFKILLLTLKAIYGHAPGYLTDLIAIKEQLRYHLRSASGLILKYPSLKYPSLKLKGIVLFHRRPLTYGTVRPSYPPCGQFWTF